MQSDKITAVTIGCGMAILLSWQGLEHLAEDGLTFREWVEAIAVAAIVGALLAWQGYAIVRRFFPDDDE